MPVTVTVNLAKAISSATILGGASSSGSASQTKVAGGDQANSGSDTPQSPKQQLRAQEDAFSQINQMLKNVVDKLNEFYKGVFAAHKDEIARLSVEIARKILVQKVENGDYEIESIVKEALSNAPARHDIVVHLNPDDFSKYQKLREAPRAPGGDEPTEDLEGVKFVPDANIGPAQCILETPKGIIESLIDQHLEQVSNALKKVK